MTEERIAHILSEASQMMKTQVEDSHSNDSKSPNQGQSNVLFQCPSPLGKDGSQNRRLKKYENDDIPQEKVVRIYQEELAKLMGRRMEDTMRGPREHFPSAGGGGGGGPMDRTQEEIRMALDAYHRELAKLNSVSSCPTVGSPAGLPAFKCLFSCSPGVGPGSGGQQSTTGGSSASSPLSNSILPPAMTPADEFSGGAAAASPLQRMASITNSLISQPSTPTHHSPSQRPLKAVLPPITQQQFDMFNNLNTEDIVKKVKESLSQYSISQRLFGESVLGLSQGSVSDLLARPKPWHMLTQKGREPFIRMKMFLEDDNAVHKLVASQYKIAPEKLMRTGSYAGGPPCSSLGKPQPPSSKLPDSLSNKNMPGDNQGSILPPSLQLIPPHPQQPPSVPQPPPPPLMVTPPGHHSIGSLSSSDLKKPQQNQQSSHPNLHPSPHHPPHQTSALRALQQHMTPSVYEMAALTQDLDTQVITTKIKEALLANNIGQKIFGEAVLGLSQGSVSELLSKPKPWHMLSIKGREPFIRMQLWLSDAHNVDRLQALKNERREANKRRRSSGPGGGLGGGGGGGADNSSDTSSNDTSEFYHSPSPGPGPPSAKKQRVLFSEEQKEALRLAFALDSYPNVATIEFLSSELALSSRTITNWFHNHRMRLKQQVPHGLAPDGGGILPPPRSNDPSNGGQQSFDPVQFRLLLNQRLLELQKERMGLGSVPCRTPHTSPPTPA
ncbi:hypothetical protein ANN_07134 [Periplaneta americana]|uniref:DNA-binding protein SATB n=1 Tax=Periplaneta americana TaxID=6978 RepID=A0ABQ8TFI9_PERAM|nr:hypothetical protein ANN_07134 [Periplaneta americana]